ncbi:MAG: aspartate aminotransferase family protein [Chitinivibrionales bacterium]
MTNATIDTLFVPTYKRNGAPMVRGKGIYLYDSEGKEYLDFGSGIAVTALGHGHQDILSALQSQGELLLHGSNLYYMQPQIDLANELIDNSFGHRVFLCNSGTEAVEAAIKFARKSATNGNPDKYHVLSFTDGFHGRTYGALSATAQEKFHTGFSPIVPGFHYAPFNDITAAEEILDKHDFAAIIVEPLQGEGGINLADTRFLQFLRSYATEHSIALIFDEIQCGIGRTGVLWQYEHHNVIPDMITLAKPLGGGLPLGAVVCTETIASAISPGDHGTTFGGNPLACALGTVVMKTVSQKSFLSQVRQNGAYLIEQLVGLAQDNKSVTEVRGMGLMLGIRLADDPSSIVEGCRDEGLLVIKAAHNTIRFLPPLTVEKEHIDKALEIVTGVLNKQSAK